MFLETPHAMANVLVEITGVPVISQYGALAPGTGKTTLSLNSSRIVEQTRYKVMGIGLGARHCEVPLSRLDSCEILEQGNPMWIVLALTTGVITFGVGLILFGVLYFLLPKKYFVVRSGNNVVAVTIDRRTDMDRAQTFMAEIGKIGDRALRLS